MKNLLIPLALMTMSTSYAYDSNYDYPTRNADGTYNNINNRKEYRYDVYPGLVIWREHGRAYWRKDQTVLTPTVTFIYFKDGKEQRETLSALDREDKRILYPKNEAQAKASEKQDLNMIANKVAKNRDDINKVIIEGHASEPGTRNYNMELSRERAENVRQYLISQGVTPSMIELRAYGESETLDSRRKSRRVEVEIQSE